MHCSHHASQVVNGASNTIVAQAVATNKMAVKCLDGWLQLGPRTPHSDSLSTHEEQGGEHKLLLLLLPPLLLLLLLLQAPLAMRCGLL
jgi:hypothetical protein